MDHPPPFSKIPALPLYDILRGRVCEKFHQLLGVGRWFPPGTPVSSTRKLISSSSFHRLDMTLAVAKALNPSKPNQTILTIASSTGPLKAPLTKRVFTYKWCLIVWRHIIKQCNSVPFLRHVRGSAWCHLSDRNPNYIRKLFDPS